MIKINLLPPELLAERGKKASQAKVYKSVAVFVAVLLLAFAAQMALTLQLGMKVKDVRAERTAVEAQVATYGPLVQLQNSVEARKNLVVQAMGAPLMWRDALGALGLHIPGNVWLTNIAVVNEEGVGAMLLRGITYDHPATAGWAATLMEIPGVRDVRVSFSAEEELEQRMLIRYEVRVLLDTVQFDPLQKRGE